MDDRTASISDMDPRVDAPLIIARLANSVHLSSPRFAHPFGRDVGVSLARFPGAWRLVRARLVIDRMFLSITEVLVLVGWNDPSHFSREFRRFDDLPPPAPTATRARVTDGHRPCHGRDQRSRRARGNSRRRTIHNKNRPVASDAASHIPAKSSHRR
jgi:AraC-like DNA-binding protein